MSIDLDNLASQIRKMKHHSMLYKVLKRELNELGYWKNRPRGKHDKGKLNPKKEP